MNKITLVGSDGKQLSAEEKIATVKSLIQSGHPASALILGDVMGEGLDLGEGYVMTSADMNPEDGVSGMEVMGMPPFPFMMNLGDGMPGMGVMGNPFFPMLNEMDTALSPGKDGPEDIISRLLVLFGLLSVLEGALNDNEGQQPVCFCDEPDCPGHLFDMQKSDGECSDCEPCQQQPEEAVQVEVTGIEESEQAVPVEVKVAGSESDEAK